MKIIVEKKMMSHLINFYVILSRHEIDLFYYFYVFFIFIIIFVNLYLEIYLKYFYKTIFFLLFHLFMKMISNYKINIFIKRIFI